MSKTKSKKEQYCNLIYNKILKQVIEPITGDQTTYLDDLLRVGKKMLGIKFKGVYPK